jgi:hypothetical protein
VTGLPLPNIPAHLIFNCHCWASFGVGIFAQAVGFALGNSSFTSLSELSELCSNLAVCYTFKSFETCKHIGENNLMLFG